VAQFYERFNRVHDTLAPADAREFRTWFWAIPAPERFSVIWMLAN